MYESKADSLRVRMRKGTIKADCNCKCYVNEVASRWRHLTALSGTVGAHFLLVERYNSLSKEIKVFYTAYILTMLLRVTVPAMGTRKSSRLWGRAGRNAALSQ